MEPVEPVGQRARRGKAALASAPEPPGDGTPRQPEQLRLEAPEHRAKPRIGLQMPNVRHTVEPGDVENQHREDHLRVAPTLGRAAARTRETGQDALRRQHFEQQQQPAARRRGRALPRHFELDRRAIRQDHVLHPAGDAPRGGLEPLTHCKQWPSRALTPFLLADRGWSQGWRFRSRCGSVPVIVTLAVRGCPIDPRATTGSVADLGSSGWDYSRGARG